MTWDEWDPENDREWEEYSRDSAIDEARVQLERFLQQKSNEIFYMSQLQVLFEKTFFHWITSKAVNELLRDKVLRSEVRDLVEGQPQGSRVKFVFSPKNRFVKRPLVGNLT